MQIAPHPLISVLSPVIPLPGDDAPGSSCRESLPAVNAHRNCVRQGTTPLLPHLPAPLPSSQAMFHLCVFPFCSRKGNMACGRKQCIEAKQSTAKQFHSATHRRSHCPQTQPNVAVPPHMALQSRPCVAANECGAGEAAERGGGHEGAAGPTSGRRTEGGQQVSAMQTSFLPFGGPLTSSLYTPSALFETSENSGLRLLREMGSGCPLCRCLLAKECLKSFTAIHTICSNSLIKFDVSYAAHFLQSAVWGSMDFMARTKVQRV